MLELHLGGTGVRRVEPLTSRVSGAHGSAHARPRAALCAQTCPAPLVRADRVDIACDMALLSHSQTWCAPRNAACRDAPRAANKRAGCREVRRHYTFSPMQEQSPLIRASRTVARITLLRPERSVG